MSSPLCRTIHQPEGTFSLWSAHCMDRWESCLPTSSGRSPADLKVKRCIKLSFYGRPDKAQLHHSSDASQDSYGTVSYLKLKKNNITC